MAINQTVSLLPAGLYDLLPPFGRHERFINGHLLQVFEQFGYAQVSPPLMEFEASLLDGRGEALAAQTFRVMDPASQQMMGVRPDITMQVARVAAGRLASAPHPLRLAYGGSTIRMKGEGKNHARQWRQAGVELIGSNDPQADAEVIAVAVQGVLSLGVTDLVVDLNFPGLVNLLLESAGLTPEKYAEIERAVECKDSGRVKSEPLGGDAKHLAALMECAGDADAGLKQLAAMKLSDAARKQVQHIADVVKHLREWGVPVSLTIDPVENRGFEYHSTISFTLFCRQSQNELGRGGRYVIMQNGEAATGVTLFVNTLMDVVPLQPENPRLLVPGNAGITECTAWQKQGYDVVRAIGGAWDAVAANKQGCTHYVHSGKIQKTSGK